MASHNQGTEIRLGGAFSKTSSTALDNVTGMALTLLAGRSYRFRAVLFTDSNSGGGVKFSVSGTAVLTAITYEGLLFDAGVLKAQTRGTAYGTTICNVSGVSAALCIIEGEISVSGTGGTLLVQFAQSVSNGTASRVLGRSHLSVVDNT